MNGYDELYIDNNPDQLALWDKKDDNVTLQDVDTAIKLMVEARTNYENLKEMSDTAHAKHEEYKQKVIDLMDATGRKEYHVPTIGKVIRIDKMQVTTPKSPEDKDTFFKFLENTLDHAGFLHYATINHNSLNSLYNEMYENSTNKEVFQIPGIASPTVVKSIRFNTDRRKA